MDIYGVFYLRARMTEARSYVSAEFTILRTKMVRPEASKAFQNSADVSQARGAPRAPNAHLPGLRRAKHFECIGRGGVWTHVAYVLQVLLYDRASWGPPFMF